MPGSNAHGSMPERSASVSRQISERKERKPFGLPSVNGEFANSAVATGCSASDTRSFLTMSASEEMLHAFGQRADAAPAVIGNRPVAFEREGEFLVLGADAELRLRLDAGFEPRDQFVARFDRCQVDLVTGHGEPLSKGGGPYT